MSRASSRFYHVDPQPAHHPRFGAFSQEKSGFHADTVARPINQTPRAQADVQSGHIKGIEPLSVQDDRRDFFLQNFFPVLLPVFHPTHKIDRFGLPPGDHPVFPLVQVPHPQQKAAKRIHPGMPGIRYITVFLNLTLQAGYVQFQCALLKTVALQENGSPRLARDWPSGSHGLLHCCRFLITVFVHVDMSTTN